MHFNFNSRRPRLATWLFPLVAATFTLQLCSLDHLLAQNELTEPDSPQTDWVTERNGEDQTIVMTKRLTLHPAAEPKPALQHRLIPDLFDLKPGNAALYYLKAMGFFEQTAAKRKLFEYQDQRIAEANETGVNVGDLPPYNWLEITPHNLPLEQVKEYLVYTSFQPQFMTEAKQLDSFSLDRNLRDLESPISYLLPEIQAMRELARMQSLRCRVAIAENRAEDAIEILGQQFAMAHHLGGDEFVICNLVGAAISNIAWTDLLYVLEMPNAPNLYWAIATLPQPLIDMKRAFAFERQLIYQQLKSLNKVDRTLRNKGYWQDFTSEMHRPMVIMAMEGGVDSSLDNTPLNRANLIGLIAAAYPGARDFLIEELGYPVDEVDAYPTAQVVFLAMRHFYERFRDDSFKLHYLPYAQALEKGLFKSANEQMQSQAKQLGWSSLPTTLLLGWFPAPSEAKHRVQMQTAVAQSIESIRDYAFANQGQLPDSLENLALPAPENPASGRPFDYIKTDNSAILSGSVGLITYKLILEVN